MRRSLTIAGVLLLILLLLLGLMLISSAWWLPRVIALWLAPEARVETRGGFGWQQGRLTLPVLSYWQGECPLAKLEGASVGRQQGIWLLHVRKARINSQCLSQQPGATSGSLRSLPQWQALLPTAKLDIGHLEVAPWQSCSGALQLIVDHHRQVLLYQSEQVQLEASLNGQLLTLQRLTLPARGTRQPITLHGKLHLAEAVDQLPESGELKGNLLVSQVPAPLYLTLNWQHQQGELQVAANNQSAPLLQLPWQASAQQIRLSEGHWQWPWAAQPLSGGVTVQVDDWQKGIGQALISGRFNVVTTGRGGRGNMVISFGPGKPDWQQSAVPFRITGASKLANLLFFATLPGQLEGPLLDPQLRLHQGALLRMRGRLLSTLEVDEARWPLAGVSVSGSGINGRLQAILSAHDSTRGAFRLHLDGEANDFWPDKGLWRWRYWGRGRLTPFAARWNVNGRGNWNGSMIELERLSTGFDQISYGAVKVHQPRLTLSTPVRWQRGRVQPAFNGALKLDAQQIRFSYGGSLPDSHLTLELKGRDPTWFLWHGSLAAGDAGPVRVNGRWDGERLRGQAWWPEQPLSVFQPLLAPQIKMRIQDGTLRAQAAFSAASDQGFSAGGHFVVQDGAATMPDNIIKGVDFSLPFRFAKQQWQFGARSPVALRIASISNQFELNNITADLQGWYPWSATQPLWLSKVNVTLLDGQLSLESLRMPQTSAATVQLKHISMSELVTALQPKQIALSGFVHGALPLWLNNATWRVKGGWVANEGPLTLRLDKDLADAVADHNMAVGAAINWLRYMEISRARARIDLDNPGWLTITAQVNGASQFSDRKQRVLLHYSQRENLFQLWRSLRFGANLQSWLQHHAHLPPQKDKTDDI